MSQGLKYPCQYCDEVLTAPGFVAGHLAAKHPGMKSRNQLRKERAALIAAKNAEADEINSQLVTKNEVHHEKALDELADTVGPLIAELIASRTKAIEALDSMRLRAETAEQQLEQVRKALG